MAFLFFLIFSLHKKNQTTLMSNVYQEDNQIEDPEMDQDLLEVLDKLIEIHQEDMAATLQQDQQIIDNALSLNNDMQKSILEQIKFVDEQLDINHDMMVKK